MRGIAVIFLVLAALPARGLELRGRLVPASGKPVDLAGTVVWIEDGAKLPEIPGEPKTRSMNQLDRRFSPGVLAVRAGDKVRFENLDTVFHNVFSLDKANPFDLGLYKGSKHFAPDLKTPLPGGSIEQAFPSEGKFLVFCNIHPDMVGMIYVFAHGYFAQADRDGLFVLPVPKPGRYRLAAGGPLIDGVQRAEAAAGEDGSLSTVAIGARARAKKVAHTRKDGAAYPAKSDY